MAKISKKMFKKYFHKSKANQQKKFTVWIRHIQAAVLSHDLEMAEYGQTSPVKPEEEFRY